jgi:hydrogenase maturation protein HypF
VNTIARARTRARVEGVVQGVGFRPFAHRLAREHALSGWVHNDEHGVLLEVEGAPTAVERFLERLVAQAPPLAVVERVRAEPLSPTGEEGFRILPSRRTGEPVPPRAPALVAADGPPLFAVDEPPLVAADGPPLVAADAAPCSACLAELFDPRDRRYRYPFVNCTDCGPRFTIVRGVPYDRACTTMAAFELCTECRAEYEDPASRRFHAQPNACPACGPSTRLVDRGGRTLPAEDPVSAAAAALAAGQIVAVKGLGGYHLACRADDERAVAELRRRKRREEKAFALMVSDPAAASALVFLTAGEEDLLKGRERPIVIARRRPGARVAESVAPGSLDLGVMLASTPLHHLLLADVGATLVMTSGNSRDEPIAHRDDDALRCLGALADVLLMHDRPIQVRADDSVVRSLGDGSTHPLMLRRSRGYVPARIELPLAAPPLLACGAELKSTFCLARGSRAWPSQHIGDLKNWKTLDSFRASVGHFERLFGVTPEVLVHDLHPDYLSTGYALQRQGVELIAVQHHHAHLAACLAEHGERGPAIGAIYDGAGLGTDGTIWGGELLAGDLERFERVGHLQPVPLPGGDAAVREPWRMACAWLLAAFGADTPPPGAMAARIDRRRWEQIAVLARSGTASPLTTSVGRLFDAVAALCGLRVTVHEEGRAAIELEAAAARGERGSYPMAIVGQRALRLDARETVRAIVGDLAAGTSAAVVSARFHSGLAGATAAAISQLAQRRGVGTAVLSGGAFQNRLLIERTAAALRRAGLRVLIPRQLPPNDGGIAYGQAAVAAARISGAA